MFQDKEKIPKNLILPFTDHRHTDQEVVISRGEGPYLFDINGQKYLDGFSSLWVATLGHNHPVLTGRIIDQLGKVAHASLFSGAHVPAIELTDRLLRFMKLPEYSILYSSSGSEAVEAAIKITMDYWRERGEVKRKYILTFENSYHGETTGAMNVSGFQDHEQLYPHLMLPKKVAKAPVSTIQVAHSGGRKEYDSFEDIIEKHSDEIGGIIIEPVYGAGGVLFPDDEFLNKVETVNRKNDYLLIIDEVATGFYRTGDRFCYQRLNFHPDIVILGKALTAGYLPLSATVISPRVGKLYQRDEGKAGIMHGHTFSGNPLSCAAALGNLDVLESADFTEKLYQAVTYFSEKILSISHPNIAEIRHRGLFAGVELFNPNINIDWNKTALDVCNEAKRTGVLTRPLGNTIVLAPPLIIAKEDIDFLFDNLYQAIQNVVDINGTGN